MEGKNMTTKLREGIISLSRDKRKRKWIIVLAVISVIAMFLMWFFEKMIIVGIMALLGLLLLFIDEVLDSIEKQKDEIIEKNKLLYIILSEKRVVDGLVLWCIALPIIHIICKFVEINFFTGAIIVIVSFVGIIKLSSIITTHFEKKLSKE